MVTPGSRRRAAAGTLEAGGVAPVSIASPEPLRLKLTTTDGINAIARYDLLDKPQDPLEGKVLAILEEATAPVSSAVIREKLGVRNQAVAKMLGVSITKLEHMRCVRRQMI